MKWTENSIQSLKAQEAKDLAIEFLQKLEAKEMGPISPAEVQIKELEFALALRQAEIEDNRCREAHEEKIKELELEIHREKTRWADAENHADQIRQEQARVIERVADATESLSTQLERVTRAHNLKIEQLETAFATKQEQLGLQIQQLEEQRSALRDEISSLTNLHDQALEVGQLREEIERRKKEIHQEHAELVEQVAAAEFQKSKSLGDVKRAQELELAQLDAQHQKDVLQRNRKAAESILESLDLLAVNKTEWERLREELQAAQETTALEVANIREQSREEFRREFNITRQEAVDVTDLFYREQAARTEVERLREHVEKLDAEIRRMRQHIEQEPQRIAATVEAAKTQVQNYIEQGLKR